MKKKLSILILLLIGFFVQAEEIRFTASAPKVVSTGEQFRLTFTLNTKADQLLQPDLSVFNVLMGPSSSYSQSTSIVNGKMTRSVSYTYTYILQAKNPGKYIISSATAKVGKKSYKSQPIKIEVVNGGQKTSNQAAASGSINSGANTGVVSNKDLFVRASVNKKEVYVGEHLTATIKIYSKVNLSGFEDVKFPSFDGFLKSDIETPPLRSLDRENVNGQIYGTGVISRVVLFPQKSGTLVIDPVEIECLVQQRSSKTSNSFFDDFFDSYKTVRKSIKSPALKIKVKPLPSGKPTDFSGAVGSFKLSASVDKVEVKANEAVTLKVRISGNGNLKLIAALKVNFPLDFESYDPKISSNLKTDLSGSSGTKTFEYLMIPRFKGDYRISPLAFNYFDPATGKYKTLYSKEFQINVLEGDDDGLNTVLTSPSKEGIKFIGKDIRFIKTSPFKLVRKGETVWGSLWFIGLYIISLLIFIAVYIFRRKKLKEESNIELLKNKKANKFAKKRLKFASAQLKTKNSGAFYEAVLKALWGYLSDKLGIPLSELSRDNAVEELKLKGIDEELVKEMIGLIDQCEFAQYAPSVSDGNMDDIYKQAVKMISKMENKVK
ncbi:MAG: protein BatD [Bacteroidales bacterium]|nr:protein BatD [Bacteroidales bacterium]